jgi:hypothetical protein
LLDAWRDISTALGVPFGAPQSMLASMCTFPLPNDPNASDEAVLRLHDALFDDYKLEVPAMQTNGKLYVRASATPYTDRSDFESLRVGLLDLAKRGRLQ